MAIADSVDGLVRRVKRKFNRDSLPKSRAARIAIGIALVLGGIMGFLPILGFWMVPMGVAVLAIDVPIVRRFARRVKTAFGRWRKPRKGR